MQSAFKRFIVKIDKKLKDARMKIPEVFHFQSPEENTCHSLSFDCISILVTAEVQEDPIFLFLFLNTEFVLVQLIKAEKNQK